MKRIQAIFSMGILYTALLAMCQQQVEASFIGANGGPESEVLMASADSTNVKQYHATKEDVKSYTRSLDSRKSTTVECGAIVGTLRIQEMKSKLLSSSHIPSSAAGFSIYLVNHDVQARKICASCRDAADAAATGNVVWQEYCGESAYGNNATVSGLMLVPIDENGDLIEGPLAGHISAHQSLTETFSQIPSETFDQFDKHWLSIVAASSGKIAIEPDYLGYGESSNFFKSFLVRPAYATATIPLWQSAVKMIAEESSCYSYLKPVVYVAGYGEGAFAALSIADALTSTFNVQIVKASLGGGPYRLGSLALPRLVDSINEKKMTADHYYVLALFASAFSSTNSWLANVGYNQDLLDASYRDRIVGLVQEGGSADSFLESLPPKVTDIIDPRYFSWMKSMAVQGEYMGCLAGPPIQPDFNGHFCLALLENDLTSVLHDAEYDIDLCHSPDDEVFHIDNLPPQLNADITTRNPRLTRQLASGSHDSAYRFCSQLAITEGLFTNPRLSPIVECGAKATPQPTLGPATTVPTGTPIVATLTPTPKPTTRVVGITEQTSSARRLGIGCVWMLLVLSMGLTL
ncbi:unnamed protein product [Cylindrotheca closterium]|uniref:Uncharacterized protein n=1 Tax=Cylindrotheca closterium TaxID=2856 RepID=A0AAD2JJF3_9STRA|nr:unnamed protein product [Cylindrotheca closterium]